MTLQRLLLLALFVATSLAVMAQESHYHKGLRSDEENAKYGVVGMSDGISGGLTSGIYWSRVRHADDVAIVKPSAADSLWRKKEFMRLQDLATDAYAASDDQHAVLYGDSALKNGYHTADLYMMMAISYERLQDFKQAKRSYLKAISAGHLAGRGAYREFKKRQKVRKAAQKGAR